jgi:hypothetical protein
MKLVYSIVLVYFLLTLALTGCQKKSDINFLESNSCIFPCWNNVTQGVTSKTDFISMINQIPNIDLESIYTNGGSWTIYNDRVFFKYIKKEIYGVGYFYNDRIALLDFSGELETTFGQLVDVLGEPKLIINIPLSGGIPGSPSTSYAVTAIYPSLGMAYTYDTRNIIKLLRAEIQPDIPITNLFIFDPELFNEMIDEKLFSQSFLTGEETRKHFIPWNGYGSLQQKYPPAKLE